MAEARTSRMSNTRYAWMYLAVVLTLSGIVSAQDDPKERGDRADDRKNKRDESDPVAGRKAGADKKLKRKDAREWQEKDKADTARVRRLVEEGKISRDEAREWLEEARRRVDDLLGAKREKAAARGKMARHVRERLGSLLPRICEDAGRRYDLDEQTVEELRQSIRESFDVVLREDDATKAFSTPARLGDLALLQAVLAEPGCKAAFSRHLDEKQLQDYLGSTAARKRRDRRAFHRQLTVRLDRQLSLTVDQREKLARLLNSGAGAGRPEDEHRRTAMSLLTMGAREQTRLVRRQLGGREVGMLSGTQMAVWKGLATPEKSREEWWQEDKDEEEEEWARKKEEFDEAEAEIMEALRDGKITRKEATQKLEFLKDEWWGDPGDDLDDDEDDEDDEDEDEDDEDEDEDEDDEDEDEDEDDEDEDEDSRTVELKKAEAGIKEAVDAGKIDVKQAAARLEALKRRLRGNDEKRGAEETRPQDRARLIAGAKLATHTGQLGPLDARASRRLTLVAKGVVEQVLEAREQRKTQRSSSWQPQPGAGPDITSHPLYQRTIADVLSGDALARYRARQAERRAFRQQALRHLVVTTLDTYLWLGATQRKHFEEAAAKLPDPPATTRTPAPVRLLAGLFEGKNRQVLSPSQRRRFRGLEQQFGYWIKMDDADEEPEKRRLEKD